MSEVKNKKKKSSMIQVSIGVLAVILAILIIIMMGIVSDIQGTARIVNYTGLVRGETEDHQAGGCRGTGRCNDPGGKVFH